MLLRCFRFKRPTAGLAAITRMFIFSIPPSLPLPPSSSPSPSLSPSLSLSLSLSYSFGRPFDVVGGQDPDNYFTRVRLNVTSASYSSNTATISFDMNKLPCIKGEGERGREGEGEGRGEGEGEGGEDSMTVDSGV